MILRLIQPGRKTTILRRSLTIPSILIGGLVGWLLAPAWLLIAALADLLVDRRSTRWVRIRLLGFGLGYLACETAGILIAFGLWLALLMLRPTQATYRAWNFKLQCEWGAALLRVGQATFGFRFEVTGEETVSPGPILLLLRHSSLADTVLAVSQISRPYSIVLRYVLKRPLLMDPCIDIVGQRLINLFVLKGARVENQIRKVGELAEGLGPGEGVLLYPEGTRFTSDKRAAHLAKLERRNDAEELSFADSLEHLLPPIKGGVLALLETNSEARQPADVVFCAHQGFEGSATLRDLLAGDLLHRTVKIHFWRVSACDIPAQRTQRIDWLQTQWRLMDQTVGRLDRLDR